MITDYPSNISIKHQAAFVDADEIFLNRPVVLLHVSQPVATSSLCAFIVMSTGYFYCAVERPKPTIVFISFFSCFF
jgi:hypothetical protein